MGSVFGRLGLFILAFVILFLANRLHKKAGAGGGGPQGGNNPKSRNKKVAATIMAFFGGCALVGTFVSDWMSSIGGASPLVAAAFFLASAGVLIIDWWSDGVPDRPAFIAAALLPIAAMIGMSQLDTALGQVGDKAEQVGHTIQNGSK